MHVTGITFTNSMDSNGERFQNVAIHVGDQPAVIGALVANPECAFFVGPSATGNIQQIMCTEPLVGRYLQLQMRDPFEQVLQISEIDVSFVKKSNKPRHMKQKSHPLVILTLDNSSHVSVLQGLHFALML
jgi:hypothetical protein